VGISADEWADRQHRPECRALPLGPSADSFGVMTLLPDEAYGWIVILVPEILGASLGLTAPDPCGFTNRHAKKPACLFVKLKSAYPIALV